jgi:hypothetical protein
MSILRAALVAIALLLLLAPAAAAAPPPAAPTQQQLEQRKLQLEIHKLEEDTGAAARWRAWLPAGSAVIALIAAGFGAFQYFRDQRTARAIRVQEQYSKNLAELVQYAEPDSSTSVRAVAALVNLRQVVPLAEDSDRHRDQVTDIIATMVTDLDFDNADQVRFDGICLDRWPEYGRWLDSHVPERSYILYKYQRALTKLAEKHPAYFRDLRMDTDGQFVVPAFIPEQDYTHFQRLVGGYQLQLARLQPGTVRADAVNGFATSLDNQRLARDLFRD